MRHNIATEEMQQRILAMLTAVSDEILKEDAYAKSKIAESFFAMNRTGKQFGVEFFDYDYNPSPDGTRTRDAINMIARPSTDTIRARNDFEDYTIFYGLTVNGYYSEAGEFVVTYFEWEDGFDRRIHDTYVLYGTYYWLYDIKATSVEKVMTDKPAAGFAPEGKAIRPDGSIRPFVAIAAYMASLGDDGLWASVSGRSPVYNVSENSNMTMQHAKGTQYGGTSTMDVARLQDMSEVAFATRYDRSVMCGCLSYNFQYAAAQEETDVERIVITNAQAANVIIGARVSIGEKGSNESLDRGQTYLNNLANRKIVTKIEALSDGSHSAVYVDNGGETFDVTATTYISSMPWNTGMTDSVLATCGSPVSNTSGKYPCKLFGVEMRLGLWEMIGNQIDVVEDVDGVLYQRPYVCYDSRLIAKSITSDYVKTNFLVPITDPESWVAAYISKFGYDPENPSVRMPVKIGATSTTGMCAGIWSRGKAADEKYEVLFGGYLNYGAYGGLASRACTRAPSTGLWHCGGRLSSSVCGVAA